MKIRLMLTITILMSFIYLPVVAQDFVGYMQQGKSYFTRQNYLGALESFTYACILAQSDIEKKDSESWRSNSFRSLQKQIKENENQLRSNDSAINRAKYLAETIYFYDNRLVLAYKDKKYGFIDKKGNTVIPFSFDEASSFDSFSGFARVCRNKTYYLIDSAGNEYPLAANLSAINGGTVAIDLRNNYLTEIPTQVFNCISLKVLLLGNNSIIKVPQDISKLKSLLFLDLSNNKIQNLPDGICDLLNLKHLYLSGNQIGKLPDGFSQLQNLEELKLDNNILFILPTGFGNLFQLNYLNLSDNKLKSIPSEVGRLNRLKTLIADNNNIETISPDAGNLERIEKILLNGNNIIDIPVSFERLKNLRILQLSKNRIANVPIELKKLNSLKEFDLRGNRFPEDKKGMIKSWFPGCEVRI